jgi:hypothetical protein
MPSGARAKGPSAAKAPVVAPEVVPDDVAPVSAHTAKCWDARESPLAWSLFIRKWLHDPIEAKLAADMLQLREQKLCEMLFTQCSIGRSPSPLMMEYLAYSYESRLLPPMMLISCMHLALSPCPSAKGAATSRKLPRGPCPHRMAPFLRRVASCMLTTMATAKAVHRSQKRKEADPSDDQIVAVAGGCDLSVQERLDMLIQVTRCPIESDALSAHRPPTRSASASSPMHAVAAVSL